MDAKVYAMINDLTRPALVQLLENYGFAVYDSETSRTLREAVHANYEDGTISGDDIALAWDDDDK